MNEQPDRRRPFATFLPWALGAVAALVAAWLLAWPGPITAVDIDQHRATLPLPAPSGDATLSQTFVPTHDGLSAVELQLIPYDPTTDGRLTLTLTDRDGPVATTTLDVASSSGRLPADGTYQWQFDSQPRSAGRTYTLTLTGSGANTIGARAYGADVYADGALTGSSVPQPADLRFTTRYRLGWFESLRALGRALGVAGRLVPAGLLFLPLPGLIYLLLTRRMEADGGTAVGTAVALGIATWPLVMEWVTAVGGHLERNTLLALLGVGWLLVGALAWRRRHTFNRVRHPGSSTLLLPLLLLAGLVVRLLAIRDLAFPPWVDASRHALLTTLVADSGRAITGYLPYWTADRLPYHYGFHSLAAIFLWLTGLSLPELLLHLGQWLNALIPLTVYAGLQRVTRRRGAALLAAFLVALPLYFPGYYVTWGRFTQLTGMLLLPLLLAETWQLARGPRGQRPSPLLVALLAAGLFLIHFRVFLLFVPFALLLPLFTIPRRLPSLLLAGGGTALLAAPRLLILARQTEPARALARNIPQYNRFPTAYFNVGWERPFVILAALALAGVLLATARRRRWATFPLALALWVGCLFALLSGRYLGLPETSLINLNSMVISLFLPLAWLLGIALDRLWHLRLPRLAPVRALAGLFAGALLLLAALFGARQQITLLNPTTILARPADAPALAWAATHLPEDAVVAVNAWNWLGATWAGSDGGAWLTPLTGRRATTPPVDYIYSREVADAVTAFNAAATAVDDWSSPAATAVLREHGVTHIYVGARGGFLDPLPLRANPTFEKLFAADGVFIFALRPAATSPP